MQRASGQTVNPVSRRRRRVRWRPSPATIIIVLVAALAGLGGMFLATQIWPRNDTNTTASAVPTPASPYVSQLRLDKGGAPRKDGDQWIVPVRVTNNVKQPPAPQGTPTPNAPTPLPQPATVLNGSIKVLFFNTIKDFDSQQDKRVLIGGAFGNVTDLKYGETKTIEVVATGLEDPLKNDWQGTDYELYSVSIWTDKDPVKTPEAGSHAQERVALNPAP